MKRVAEWNDGSKPIEDRELNVMVWNNDERKRQYRHWEYAVVPPHLKDIAFLPLNWEFMCVF